MVSPIQPTKYKGSTVYLANIVVRNRRPTSADYKQPETGKNYVLFTGWQVGKDPTTGNEGELWFLSKIVSNQATWIMLNTSSGGPLIAVGVPNGDTPINPDANGLINFTSTGGTITITGSAGGLGLQDINFELATAQAQTFVTDVNSPAVPAVGVLNVVGGYTSVNNANGIRTNGSSGGNTLTIQLTNRLKGTVTTSDATPTTLVSFTLSSANLGASMGVCTLEYNIVGYNATDDEGVGYSIFGSVRTDGASATLIGVPDKIVNEEAGQVTCDANLIVSGNAVIIQVTGIAAKTINWNCVGTYVFVS